MLRVHVPLCCVYWFIDYFRAYLCNMREGGGKFQFDVICIDYMVGRYLVKDMYFFVDNCPSL